LAQVLIDVVVDLRHATLREHDPFHSPFLHRRAITALEQLIPLSFQTIRVLLRNSN
jgi:hypothetical protein